jgi:hypothetical protein
MQVTARAALSSVLLCSLGAILVLAWMERSLFAFDTWSRLVTDRRGMQGRHLKEVIVEAADGKLPCTGQKRVREFT